jgi:hypothetical protein
MTAPSVTHGMNLRTFDRIWREIGGTVEIAYRTGEAVYAHPKLDRRVRINSRRKDTPRILTACAQLVLKEVAA